MRNRGRARAAAAWVLTALVVAAEVAAQPEGAAEAAAAAPGLADATPTVVGGLEAPSARIKYQLGFLRGGCGASLIRADCAITARHCSAAPGAVLVAGAKTTPFRGALDPREGAVQATVARVVSHPDPEVDAALLFLDTCLPTTPSIDTIKLATPDDLAAARRSVLLVSGWGSVSKGADGRGQGGAMPLYLQYAFVGPQDCAAAYAGRAKPAKELCAGGVTSMNGNNTPRFTDTCQGDSGGPLTFNLANPKVPLNGSAADDRLLGITSWGDGCGVLPGVYASVPNIAEWAAFTVDTTPFACGGSVAGFARASAGANWYGRPSRSLRRPAALAAASAEEWCQQECLKRRTPPPGKNSGCVAVSISVRRGAAPGAAPRCDLYYRPPERLCGESDRVGPCLRASQGAFRLAYSLRAP